MNLELHNHSEQWLYKGPYRDVHLVMLVIRNLFDPSNPQGYDWQITVYADDELHGAQLKSKEALPNLETALSDVHARIDSFLDERADGPMARLFRR